MTRLSALIVAFAIALVGCGAGDEVAEVQAGVVVEAEQPAASDEAQLDQEASVPTTETDVEVELSESGADEPDDHAEVDADASDEERAISFARCMRDEGVDFPDPAVNADGSVDMLGNVTPGSLQPNSDSFQSAAEVCGPIVAGASFLPGADIDEAVAQENLLAFAQCLRDLGYDVIDPKLSDVLADGPGALARAFGENFDPSDPANSDAVQECQRVIQGNGAGDDNG